MLSASIGNPYLIITNKKPARMNAEIVKTTPQLIFSLPFRISSNSHNKYIMGSVTAISLLNKERKKDVTETIKIGIVKNFCRLVEEL
jgi:hypothetical protein